MSGEEWREVFDGYYEVSNLGNVRRAKPGISTFVGRPVLGVCGPSGYFQVQLQARDKKRRAYVHHLIAEAFIGPRPDGHVVNHIDSDRQNNALSNLEYVTSRRNAEHALQSRKRRKGPTMPQVPLKGRPRGEAHWSSRMPERVSRGERQGASKMTEAKVREMRAMRESGQTVDSVAKHFNISIAQASRIIRGLRWAHVQ